MKQIYFKFSMLLVCLVMGLGSAMAQGTVVKEDVDGSATISGTTSWSNDDITIVASAPSGGSITVTCTPKSDLVEVISFSVTAASVKGNKKNNSTNLTTKYSGATISYTVGNQYNSYTLNSATVKYSYRKVTGIKTTISAAGYATFVNTTYNTQPADGVVAYAGKINSSYTSVALTSVGSIPAGSAVIIKGAQGTYEFPVVVSATPITANISNLIYSTTETTVDGTQYILAKKGDTVGFFRATTGKIAPYKAFFVSEEETPEPDETMPAGDGTTPAKFFVLDETTSISDITTKAPTGVIYNLAGQPVDANYKGIVIKNGKKYLNK